jgi:hypothetical protein
MKTLNLPNHIIFGAKFPRMRVVIEGTRQSIFSMNNYNLFLEESDLNSKGTFTISALFKSAKNCPYCLRWTSVSLPECEAACNPCSLFAEKYEQLPAQDALTPYDGLMRKRVHLHRGPQVYNCELLSALLGCTTTSAERKFAEAYYHLAISWVDFPEEVLFSFRDIRKTYGDFLKSWHEDQSHLSLEAREPKEVIRAILDSLTAPALIPQVWFNCMYAPSGSSEHEWKEPICVDFIFIFENKLHVVEIDDPSHYARPNSSLKWVADEEAYTSNLKVERYLRSHGYEVHRLSSWEILNATESELIDLLIDVLGMPPSHFRPRLLASQ